MRADHPDINMVLTVENAGFYQHRVVDKVRIADSLAVAAYGIDHSQHFLNNDLIPHRC